ncbi:AMP-binding protein [Nocardioides sp.]|uniref:AMP-binding protein n=1 Tax=Nocardioides sp. TaxID=35761 RepID=UPI0027274E26|nr:AMP-binding protein [Nocardioides sp.]MDO9458388.1 AMP-binding protein [Nocardioides sp.]
MLDALLDPTGPDLPDLVTVGDAVLSRDALLDGAHGVAAELDRRTRPGPVAVHASPDVLTVVAVVGALLAGVPVVPVPPDSGPDERRHVLADSGAVTWSGPAALAGDLPVLTPGLESWAPRRVDPDATALLLYTSGTTGPPKGVPHTGRTLAACLDGLAEAWAWTPDDVLVHGLPLFHLHGLVLGLLSPLRVGSRLVHTVRPSPEAYAAAAGSVYFGVPTVWHRVAQSPEAARALRRARLLVSGSAPLPVSTFTALQELTGLAPHERYGMTETGITLAARVDEAPRPGWVGRPVGATETRIASPADGPDDEGMGRLEVRGPSVMSGYLGRPSPDLADDGWFSTGDLAVRDADGWHRIVGRESTDLIKTGGYRVGSGEVEAVLLDHPAVDEVAVVGVPDDDLGQRIVAFVVGAAAPGLETELVELVGSRLSWHKRPREVVLVDELPRNAMGKVQKTLLLDD